MSSAGNTRGLIEARFIFPVATLVVASLPRGIPAASLKLNTLATTRPNLVKSSAGNTRGLIEALFGVT